MQVRELLLGYLLDEGLDLEPLRLGTQGLGYTCHQAILLPLTAAGLWWLISLLASLIFLVLLPALPLICVYVLAPSCLNPIRILWTLPFYSFFWSFNALQFGLGLGLLILSYWICHKATLLVIVFWKGCFLDVYFLLRWYLFNASLTILLAKCSIRIRI